MAFPLALGLLTCCLPVSPAPQTPDRVTASSESSTQPRDHTDGGGLVGGSTSPLPERLAFPHTPGLAKFAPFADAQSAPQAVDTAAAGAADLDGDGNADLWFLTTSGARAGEISVQNARGSSLGRYRDWHVYGARRWIDGATFRSTEYSLGDRILLVDPYSSTLISAYYTYPFGGDPQAGTFVVNASWSVGTGAYEIATRDDDGDGHDEIGILQSTGLSSTRIKVLHMGNSLGWLQPEREVAFDLPFVATDLQLLDYDGDGFSDVLVTVPGVGLWLFRDNGSCLCPTLWLPYLSGIRAVFTGDADRDGRDDFGLVFPNGILMALGRPTGFWPVALLAPAQTGGFATARVVGDRRGNLTSVVALPSDGQSAVVYPSLGSAGFAAPEVKTPPKPAAYQGSGAIGARVIVTDVDGDADEDLVAQLPDRTHWVTLRNGEDDLGPRSLAVTDHGMIGETGYRKYGLVARVPDAAIARGLTRVEIAVFIEDVTLQPVRHVYWGRLLLDADPVAGTVAFEVYSQTVTTKLQSMIQNGIVFPYPGGISAGGDALLTIHVKSGTQRYESMLIHHDGGIGGQQSAIGIKWQVSAAPPKPDADTDLLPWN